MTSPFADREAKLVDADVVAIGDAVLAAYPDKRVLYDLLLREWGVRVQDVINTNEAGGLVVPALVRWARGEGRALDLLAVTCEDREREYRPLEKLARHWLQPPAVPETRPPAAYGGRLKSRAALPVGETSKSGPRYFTAGEAAAFARLASALCIVTVDNKPTANGFLIGRHSVLTTHSAVGHAIAQGLTGDRIRLNFDGDDQHGLVDLAAAAGTGWVGPHSAAAETEMAGRPPTVETERQLDFTVIRLADAAPQTLPLLSLPTRVPIVPPGDEAIVLYHPIGASLVMSIGRLIGYSRAGARVTYDAATAPGSAGAPVFTAEGHLIAMHHAAVRSNEGLGAGQGVPIWRIRQAIVDAGLDPAAL